MFAGPNPFENIQAAVATGAIPLQSLINNLTTNNNAGVQQLFGGVVADSNSTVSGGGSSSTAMRANESHTFGAASTLTTINNAESTEICAGGQR